MEKGKFEKRGNGLTNLFKSLVVLASLTAVAAGANELYYKYTHPYPPLSNEEYKVWKQKQYRIILRRCFRNQYKVFKREAKDRNSRFLLRIRKNPHKEAKAWCTTFFRKLVQPYPAGVGAMGYIAEKANDYVGKHNKIPFYDVYGYEFTNTLLQGTVVKLNYGIVKTIERDELRK